MRFALRAALSGALLLVLSACQSAVEEPARPLEAPSEPAFKLEAGKSVLLMPFSCNILPADYQAAGGALQDGFSGWLIYALQSAGVQAEDFAGALGDQPGASVQAGRAGGPDPYLPLTPDSRLRQGAGDSISVTPLQEGQWEDDGFAASLTAGEAPAGDEGVVPEGSLMVSPPAEEAGNETGQERAAGQGGYQTASGPAAEAGQAPESGTPAGKSRLEMALESDYDYVLTGNIVFLHTEVKPFTRSGERSASTVRGEFSCAWRLLEGGSGKVLALGATTGKAGKYLSLGSGYQEASSLNNAVSRVLNQAMATAAQNLVLRLKNPDAPANSGLYDSPESDREYYQDSPGKQLRPGY